MDIEKELNNSLDLIKKGEIFSARKLLGKVLEKTPNNFYAQSLLGIICIHEMKIKEGKELLELSNRKMKKLMYRLVLIFRLGK